MLEREKALIAHTADLDGHNQVAILSIASEMIVTGVSYHVEGHTLFLQTSENAEPLYFTVAETHLLIAALQAGLSVIAD